jgi:4-hydroxy-3-methylbut-2-en-1-yl diphosphate reductase
MNIIRAEHMGMCFGVRDAIALAETKAKEQPLTILGDIVHNETVVNRLKEQGVRIERDPAKVQTKVAMITAHGASQQAISRARSYGFELLEGTCPLVHYAHRAVAKLVQEGYYPVIIGKRDHVEVRGLTEDLAASTVVEGPSDVQELPHHEKFGVASQTTQPIDRVLYFLDLIRERFPQSEVRFVDTVCQPTKQRQRAALELAGKCDVVIVIGGQNSNNTRELVQSCLRCCRRVHHVQQPEDLRREWFDKAATVGITAGTSTPDSVIDAVEAALRRVA